MVEKISLLLIVILVFLFIVRNLFFRNRFQKNIYIDDEEDFDLDFKIKEEKFEESRGLVKPINLQHELLFTELFSKKEEYFSQDSILNVVELEKKRELLLIDIKNFREKRNSVGISEIDALDCSIEAIKIECDVWEIELNLLNIVSDAAKENSDIRDHLKVLSEKFHEANSQLNSGNYGGIEKHVTQRIIFHQGKSVVKKLQCFKMNLESVNLDQVLSGWKMASDPTVELRTLKELTLKRLNGKK